jgi:hypothetical protein
VVEIKRELDARRKIEQWRVQYNCERPHSSLGYLAPAEVAASNGQMTSEPAARSPPRAALGQQKKWWPTRCVAWQSRIRNHTVFRPSLSAGEGWAEKLY